MLDIIIDNIELVMVFLGVALSLTEKRMFRHSRKIGYALIIIGFGILLYNRYIVL